MTNSTDRNRKLWNPAVEALSRDALRALQLERLKKQMVYNFNNSEFYRGQFRKAGAEPGDIQSVEDFCRLPLMDKVDQRDAQQESLDRFGNPYELLACAPRDRIIRIVSTSGTTGVPTLYTHTAHDVAVINEMNGRKYWRAGLRPGDAMVQAVSLSMFTGGLPVSEGVQHLGACIVPVGIEGGTDRVLQFIELTRPNAIIATPSFGQYLIEECPKRTGSPANALGLKRFFCAGEPGGGMPEVRKILATGFNAEIFDHTGGGHAFHGISPAEPAERYSGMQFVSEDHCLLELIDPQTRAPIAQTDGAIGEMVFTFLDWEGTPFMRYALGDLIQIWDEPPDCLTPGRLFKIVGRADDMLIVKGVNVYPAAVQDAIARFQPRVTGHLRIALDAPGPLVTPPLSLRVEHGERENAGTLAPLAEEIVAHCRKTLRIAPAIEWLAPGTLPRESQKTQLIEITGED
jgi:phenylacetate-CoA ligase